MKKPFFNPNLFKVNAIACAAGAPVAHKTHYVHAENSACAVAKVRTFYRSEGLQVQISVQKIHSLYTSEAISFAQDAGHIQDAKHLGDWLKWHQRYSTDSKVDNFAQAFQEALASA